MTPCEFCGAPAEHVCSWPVMGAILGTAGDLAAGTRVLGSGRRWRRCLSVIRDERRWPGWTFARFERVKREIWLLSDRVLTIEGMRPCGSACCNLCMREPADGVCYCRSHWWAWESVDTLSASRDSSPRFHAGGAP